MGVDDLALGAVESRMVRRSLAYAAVVACASSAALLPAIGGETRAVVELFTSQGCSSCPPADKVLGELAADPSLVAISLPIDYWDYLGWKDTLADPRHAARQRAYSKVRGDREVYTPQVVVNGALHVLGSDRSAIEQAISKSRENPTTLPLPVKASFADGHLSVSLPERSDVRAPAEIWVAGLAKAITVVIKRGENKGKTITYHNVARRWLKVDSWSGKAGTFTVPARDLEGDDINGAAIFVQTGTVEKPTAVLGATFASFR
jgi:hypothetical protein